MGTLEQPNGSNNNSKKEIQGNSQEVKEPKDIYEFFEQIFGHEIFFIEDLMALEGENKELLHKFLKIKVNDPNKHAISQAIAVKVKEPSNRIEKFPFAINLRGNHLGFTALRILSSSSPKLTKSMVVESFSAKFADLLDKVIPRKLSDKKNNKRPIYQKNE